MEEAKIDNQQLIKVTTKDITQSGKSLLRLLSTTYRVEEKEVPGYEKTESGAISIVPVKKKFVPGNVRLNRYVQPELFVVFGSMVSKEDEARISSIIKANCFEVVKAIKVFQCAQLITDEKATPKSWEQSFEMQSPSIASIVKYKGKEKAESLVYSMIFKFAKSFGRRNDMTEEDILSVSKHIVSQYRLFTVTDLKMILNDALKVSKSRFNLDYQGIKAMFEDSFEDKQENAAEVAIAEHDRTVVHEKDARRRYEPGQKADPEAVKVMMQYYAEQAELKKQNQQTQ